MEAEDWLGCPPQEGRIVVRVSNKGNLIVFILNLLRQIIFHGFILIRHMKHIQNSFGNGFSPSSKQAIISLIIYKDIKSLQTGSKRIFLKIQWVFEGFLVKYSVNSSIRS